MKKKEKGDRMKIGINEKILGMRKLEEGAML